MGKIKINLTSGNTIEKPLVTCFQGNTGNYLVLDNEINGPMGLPVICISKFSENTVSKITDPNEWTAVKENLKAIISGSSIPYIAVPETVSGADDFYTQLSLPVASFDTLKNVYAPVETPVAPAAPEVVETVAPAAPASPIIPEAPEIVAPVSTPIAQVVSEPVMPAVDVVMPTIPSVEPIVPEAPASPVIPEAPALEPTAVTSSPVVNTNGDLASIKENFMKSCENMFDALIQQFNIK